ncbi:lysine N(6)-hydroxylase/L-ornithine N(5)-oxygenase family protein [Leisingera sp. JC1]|uniref:lysine N(6)-hydroxylase/L-ornithine N(5)-oxygenase family protein n=1 Tax=Leisingera sp. JC1 TaxID=1855282 RepID=UPI00080341B0|nr:SidA/IucD/PvdA family monooxygenase [Leisingera sp. JC1]OBY27619.1 hypothetical protein A9D60_14665 [Leisingera sp. JC1]
MCEDSPHIYRCIGIGFGPSNIALAIALEEAGELDNVLFLEKAAAPDWQGEFLIDGSDIQHNPLRDFVTPRNPASPYGFLSYLKAQGRLFEFLNLEAPYPPRTEYARYCVWVARQFDSAVRYSSAVRCLKYTVAGGLPAVRIELESGQVFLARSVSFAPGRSIHVPAPFAAHMGGRMVHAAQYRSAVARWQDEGVIRRIAVIGASQSAVEMLLDLPGHFPQAQITGICRSFGYKQKDLSPFTERVYEPEFVGRFYDAPEEAQNSMRRELWRSNYGAADHDVIAALQFRMYEQRVTGRSQIVLLDNKTTLDITPLDGAGGFELTLLDRMDRSETRAEFDAVILATGFLNHGSAPEGEPFHPLLAGIAGEARFRADGAIAQARDYRLLTKPGLTRAPVFLNGVSETSHGFGDAGSFSLLSVRSAELAGSIAGVPLRPRNISTGAGQDTPARTVQPA